MKLVNTVRLTGALLAGVLLSLFTANAFATNTAANTTISNEASVNYNVNGIAQTVINSAPGTGNSTPGAGNGAATTFLVDDKLVLTIQTIDTADVNVTPGQASAVMVFKVTNAGNATQGVTFTTVQEATGTANPFTGGTDNFDPTTETVFVSQSNTATYSSTNDTAHSIPQLASGASNYVFIVSSIPTNVADTNVAVEALVAQVAVAGAASTYGTAPGANITTDQSTATWTPGTVQNIFDDAAGTDDIALDGKISSRDAYLVKSAVLTITKTSSVISDPTGDAIPHAIPGALMMYTITVANTGTSPATSVTLADSINAQITAGNIAYKANSITLKDPNTGSPLNSTQSCADSGSTGGNFGADSCSYTSGTNTVNAVINSLTTGQTATITFEVTIQ